MRAQLTAAKRLMIDALRCCYYAKARGPPEAFRANFLGANRELSLPLAFGTDTRQEDDRTSRRQRSPTMATPLGQRSSFASKYVVSPKVSKLNGRSTSVAGSPSSRPRTPAATRPHRCARATCMDPSNVPQAPAPRLRARRPSTV
jgi:hypothetical protein